MSRNSLHVFSQYRRETETSPEREFFVVAYYTPGSPGRYSGPAEDCFPAEQGEVEVESAEWADDYTPLTAAEIKELVDIEALRMEAAERLDLCDY